MRLIVIISEHRDGGVSNCNHDVIHMLTCMYTIANMANGFKCIP